MDGTAHRITDGGSAGLRRILAGRPTRQAAVAELGQAALLGLEVNKVFDLAVELVGDMLDVEYTKILHQPADGEPLVLMAGRGWRDDVKVRETTVPCDFDSQAGFTLLSDEPVLVEDLTSEQRFAGPSLLTDHGVVSGISVVIPDRDRAYGVFGVHTRRRRQFNADDGDFLRSVANIVGGAVQNDRARRQIELDSRSQERRLRYQVALAECARTLLASAGENRLEEAVVALLSATQATYVFVERNVMDPELGFCSQTVVDVDQGNTPEGRQSDGYWDLVPWERMPTSQSYLERGESYVVIPAELEGVEYEQYAAAPFPVASELDLPIFVDGEWAGLIGFADSAVVRRWTAEDLSLLTTAATMIGAFWEREAARKNLEQLVRSKDDFIASVSHELRTPLTAIVGYSEILAEDSDTLSEEERAELVATVLAQSTDLTNIVNDLLIAARAEIGTLHVASVRLNLRAQAAVVLAAFAPDQVEHIEFVGDRAEAIGDPDRVRQIVRNLISNALRYGGDSIKIAVSSGADSASVVVSDNGPAIPTEDRERIFQPYQRAHNTPGLAGSLGLGLAISRQLARLMDGDLTYRYQGGKGTFEMTLPKAT